MLLWRMDNVAPVVAEPPVTGLGTGIESQVAPFNLAITSAPLVAVAVACLMYTI